MTSPQYNEEEIKAQIREKLSWNGFDEEVVDPIYQIFVQVLRQRDEIIEFINDDSNYERIEYDAEAQGSLMIYKNEIINYINRINDK